MKQHRRFFACLLALIMVLACIPAASAAQVPEEPSVEPMIQMYSNTYYYIASINKAELFQCKNNALTQRSYSPTFTAGECQWKCTYVSSGSFTLRPKVNESLALTVNPNTLEVYLATCTNSQYQRWYTTAGSEGYCLRCSSTDSRVNGKIITISTSNEFAVAENYYTPLAIIDIDYDIAPTSITSRTITLGENMIVDPRSLYSEAYPFYLDSEISYIGRWFIFAPYNSSIIEVVSDFDGIIRGIAPGKTYLSVIDRLFNKSWTVNFTVLPHRETAHYFYSPVTNMCISPDGYPFANNTTIEQTQYSYASGQFWELDHVGDGYYTIELMNNAATERLGYFLTIGSSCNAGDDVFIQTKAASESSGNVQKWKIEETDSGYYKLSPEGHPSLALSIQRPISSGTASSLPITLETYTNGIDNFDEWRIFEA